VSYIGPWVPFQLNLWDYPTWNPNCVTWLQQLPVHAPKLIFSWKTTEGLRHMAVHWHMNSATQECLACQSLLACSVHIQTLLSSGDSYRLKLNLQCCSSIDATECTCKTFTTYIAVEWGQTPMDTIREDRRAAVEPYWRNRQEYRLYKVHMTLYGMLPSHMWFTCLATCPGLFGKGVIVKTPGVHHIRNLSATYLDSPTSAIDFCHLILILLQMRSVTI